MNEARAIGPSWWYSLIGVALIILGCGLFAYFLWNGISHITDALTQIVVPGQTELTLQQAGMYTIFLEEQSVVDGRIFSTSESVSGLKCSVALEPANQEISLQRPSASVTYTTGGRSGRSVLQFQAKESGRCHFSCDYPAGSKGPQVVLAVGTGVGEGIMKTVFGSMIAMLGGMGSGGLVIVAIYVMQERAKKKLAAQTSPSQPTQALLGS